MTFYTSNDSLYIPKIEIEYCTFTINGNLCYRKPYIYDSFYNRPHK